MADFVTIIAIAGAAGTAISAYQWRRAREDAQFYEGAFHDQVKAIAERDAKISAMNDRLAGFEAAEFARKRSLSERGKKGRQVQLAKAKETAIEKAVQQVEARDRTMKAIASTPMRSRAKVVAPVKAARTRKKNAGGGVAASQGG